MSVPSRRTQARQCRCYRQHKEGEEWAQGSTMLDEIRASNMLMTELVAIYRLFRVALPSREGLPGTIADPATTGMGDGGVQDQCWEESEGLRGQTQLFLGPVER
eukprot:767259-Hanusia_phi.AAC.6